MTTFAAVLDRELRREPGRPLITFYDESSGERTELSVTTYANWVAKAASLLTDEFDLEGGDRLRIDLPPHWLGPVFTGAAWAAGLTLSEGDNPDAVVCGPDALDAWAPLADSVPVLACALKPMGVRFADPLPAGVSDVGVEIWGQPDAFVAFDPPTSETQAHDLDGGVTQARVWEAAAAGSVLADGGRLLTTLNPASPPGSSVFAEPLFKGGSLIIVTGASPERIAAITAAERATAQVLG